MFDDFTDAALIDAMGEASRDESAAIARRFALIGELDARRAQELADRNWWRTDPYEEVGRRPGRAIRAPNTHFCGRPRVILRPLWWRPVLSNRSRISV
jgi:hypothetical protein